MPEHLLWITIIDTLESPDIASSASPCEAPHVHPRLLAAPTEIRATGSDNSGQEIITDSNGVPTTTTYIPDISNITSDTPPDAQLAAVLASGLHACDVNKNPNHINYQTIGPFNNHHSAGQASVSWINHLFGLKNARRFNSEEHWEGMACTAGGGQTKNGWRASLSENTLLTNSRSANTLWNDKYAEKTNSGASVTRSLGFSFNGNFEGDTLGAQAQQSVTTKADQSEVNGSIGISDGHYGGDWPSKLNPYEATRLNTFWRALNKNGRSSDFVGSVGLVLYMYPESQSRSSHEFYSVAEFQGCHDTFAGVICSSLDHGTSSTPG